MLILVPTDRVTNVQIDLFRNSLTPGWKVRIDCSQGGLNSLRFDADLGFHKHLRVVRITSLDKYTKRRVTIFIRSSDFRSGIDKVFLWSSVIPSRWWFR